MPRYAHMENSWRACDSPRRIGAGQRSPPRYRPIRACRAACCVRWSMSTRRVRSREFLARRLRYVLRRDAPPGEVVLLLSRLRVVFRRLPDCLGISALVVIANARATSLRMAHGPSRCLRGDDVPHSVPCPFLVGIARHPWLLSGARHLQVVLVLLPMPDADVLTSAV